MSQDLPVLWSPAQQAWLQAMGYTVYHDGQLADALDAALQLSVAEAAGASPVAADGPPSEAPRAPRQAPTAPSTQPDAGSGERSTPPPRHSAPASAPAASVDSEPARRTGNERRPAVRLPDRLQIALLRASGCNPNDPATQALMDSWPLQQLRRDPAAKRALWPQLRALRKQARG